MNNFLASIMPMVGFMVAIGWAVVALSEDLASGPIRLFAAASCAITFYLVSRSITRSNISR